MYQQLGYIVYRTVLEYYNGDPDEDAYGKSLNEECARIKLFMCTELMHIIDLQI
jgi:hypothetical protein